MGKTTGKDSRDGVKAALELHRTGRLMEAVSAYEALVAAEATAGRPGSPLLLHLLGTALTQSGEAGRAVQVMRRATELAPESAEIWSGLGAALRGVAWTGDEGVLAEAEQAFRRAAELQPDSAQVRYSLGNVLRDLGRPDEAAREYDEAVRLEPEYGLALNNLGVLRQEQGRAAEAASLYRRAVEADPGFAEAWANLTGVLQDLGRAVEAMQAALRLLELEPDQAESHYLLGLACLESGQVEEALSRFRQALAIDPDDAESRFHLGYVLMELGRTGEAEEELRLAAEAAPEDLRPRHFLAVLAGETPEAMPPAMVADLFDEYSSRFDEHLQDTLHYRMPEYFRELYDAAAAGEGDLDILDLGCGTGLCGGRFKDLAQRLDGIDLSERMLDLARARGEYDHLAREEAVASAAARPGRYDLVLAADVLPYLGDLRPLFRAVRRALKGAGGRFILCVEALGPPPGPSAGDGTGAEGGRGFRVTQAGRFAHSPAYVLSLARESGFGLERFRRAHLRRQGGGVINGDIYLLRLE